MRAWSPPAVYWLSGGVSSVNVQLWSTRNTRCPTVTEVSDATTARASTSVVSFNTTGVEYSSQVTPPSRLHSS